MKTNHGFDKDILLVARESKLIAHLPGIGRFCLCGCNRRLEGKLVKAKCRNKKLCKLKHDQQGYHTYYQVRKDKDFFNATCRSKYYHIINHRPKEPKSISSLIFLPVMYDKKPYRMLHLYLKKGVKKEIRVTPDDKDLWNALESIARFRNVKSEIRLTEQNNKKVTSNKRVGEIKVA